MYLINYIRNRISLLNLQQVQSHGNVGSTQLASNVGAPVGCPEVGRVLGWNVGRLVGRNVGSEEGREVGAAVGTLVGFIEG